MAGSYIEEFSAKEYLDTYYSSAKGNPIEQGQFEFYSEQQYSFYKRYSCKWNKKTARLLEFGGGAVISNLIIAAPYVNKITFAAYLESERKEIELWKHGKEGAHDWSSDFKFIAGEDAWREREQLD